MEAMKCCPCCGGSGRVPFANDDLFGEYLSHTQIPFRVEQAWELGRDDRLRKVFPDGSMKPVDAHRLREDIANGLAWRTDV